MDLHCASVVDTCCGLCQGTVCADTAEYDGSRGVPGNECDLGYFCESGTCYDQRLDLPFLYLSPSSGASLLTAYDRVGLDLSRPAPETYVDQPQSIHLSYMSLGPFGAHAGDNTGHYYGDAKTNDIAYLFPDRTGMFDLAQGVPPVAHCTYPAAPGEVCGVPWQYVLVNTPGYHLPDVTGADEVFVVHVSLNNFPGLPGTDQANRFFRNPPQWEVALKFQKQKVVMSMGHLARIQAGSFLWQMIKDVTAQYNGGVGLDVDVHPSDCDATTGLCKWRAEEFVQLRNQMYEIWHMNPLVPSDGDTPDHHCNAKRNADGTPDFTDLEPEARCEIPGLTYDVRNGHHAELAIDPADVANRAFIAEPQADARELVGWPDTTSDYPGYFASPDAAGTPSAVPYATFEFSVSNDSSSNSDSGGAGRSDCVYNYLGAGNLDKAGAQSLRDNDMADYNGPAQSLRYGVPYTPPWQWSAEGLVCPVDHWGNEQDFSSLYTRLGWWLGNLGVDADNNPTWDQEFLFFPIGGNYAAQHPELWQDVATSTAQDLVIFVNKRSTALSWAIEGAPNETINPNAKVWGDVVQGPTVEPLAHGSRGRMLIRWRNVDGTERECVQGAARPCFYQQVAYQLDQSAGLTLHWGSKRSVNRTAVDTAHHTVDPVASCNQTDIICYRHVPPASAQPIFYYPQY